MTVNIRLRTEKDYPAIAAVFNAAYPPDIAQTNPSDLRHMDEAFAPKYHPRRAVLEYNGEIVGVSRSSIPPTLYHPQKFHMLLAVLPQFQRRGFGTMLYRDVLDAIAEYDPLLMRCSCCADSANSVGFLTHHGFTEELRMWESHLDVEHFDMSPYRDAIQRVKDQGIRFVPLTELPADGSWEHELYELIIHIQGDMPQPEPFVAFSFEEWKKFEFSRPNRRPESYFIAYDGDRMVGVSILMHEQSDKTHLNTDDTGVIRAYRRRGIALALKLHGIAHAQQQGYKKIRTMNESTNRPMLNINERLGYVKRPAWISFACDLTAG